MDRIIVARVDGATVVTVRAQRWLVSVPVDRSFGRIVRNDGAVIDIGRDLDLSDSDARALAEKWRAETLPRVRIACALASVHA